MPREPRDRARTRTSFLRPDELLAYELAWQRAVAHTHDVDLARGITDCRTREQYDADHQVDFLGSILPEHIQRKAVSGGPVKLLDSGCGMGLFTDQVRQVFGAAVDVQGTNLSRDISLERRKRILAEIQQENSDSYWRSGLIYIKDIRKLREFSEAMHPNDGRFRSILEMSVEPEFDLIIDEFGELFYAYMHYYDQGPSLDKQRFADRVLDACLRKLLPSGQLYASRGNRRLGGDALFNKLWLDGDGIEQHHNVGITLTGIPRSRIVSEILQHQPSADKQKLVWDQAALRRFVTGQKREYIQTIRVTKH